MRRQGCGLPTHYATTASTTRSGEIGWMSRDQTRLLLERVDLLADCRSICHNCCLGWTWRCAVNDVVACRMSV
jgi:hypothetical protein